MVLFHLAACVLNYSGAVTLDQPVEEVRVRLVRGSVEVRASDDGTTTVQFDVAGLGGVEISPVVTGGRLELPDPCGAIELCSGRYELRVPPDTTLDVEIDEGSVLVSSMRGDTVVDVGGRAQVLRHTGERVLARAGQALELELEAVPALVEGRSEQGDVFVVVPAGTYAVDATARATVTISPEIVVDPGSPATLSLTADEGAVTVSAN